MSKNDIDNKALEKAAKYICRVKCGLCPITEKGFECPEKCSMSTVPWRCWFIYFCRQAADEYQKRQTV